MGGKVDQSQQMLQITVDLAIADKSQQMEPAPTQKGMGEGLAEGGIFLKRTLPDRSRDPDDLLVDDSARPDILMADFGISHGLGGKSDFFAAGLDQGIWPAGFEVISDRCVGQFDGIAFILPGIGVSSPSIADQEYDRRVVFLGLGHKWGHCTTGRSLVVRDDKMRSGCESHSLRLCSDHVDDCKQTRGERDNSIITRTLRSGSRAY